MMHRRWLYRDKLGPCCLSSPYLHSTRAHQSFAELSSQHAYVGGKLHTAFSKQGGETKGAVYCFLVSPQSQTGGLQVG